MYQRGEKIDISSWPEKCQCNGRYFLRGDGCTWYAACRYKEIYGDESPLAFHGSGAAGNWHNVLDDNIFSIAEIRY